MINSINKEDPAVTFEWTKSLYDLQKNCPVHKVGTPDMELQRYVCPISGCNEVFKKEPLFWAEPALLLHSSPFY